MVILLHNVLVVNGQSSPIPLSVPSVEVIVYKA